MPNRIIDFSDEPASLSVRYDQLIIKCQSGEQAVPLDEIEALIVAHPAVHFTHAVLAGVCQRNGIVVFCNERRLPAGMLLPLAGNSVQTERFAAQLNLTQPARKQLWQQIAKAKVKAQGRFLSRIRGNDFGLENMAGKVRSGDATNIEGYAARRYWSALFGVDFRRLPGADNGINRLLNYGYAVMRGYISRHICAAGLHPSIGLHHHNRYNPFCLADDLIEPYRPIIDAIVYDIVEKLGADTPLDKNAKKIFFGELSDLRLRINKEDRVISDSAAITAQSLMKICLGKRKKLVFPE